ncbi:cysteine--tRNA ligase [Candidatus Campbellbacteria bacterium RIFCSPLOWO2_01_FULL_34_15]|uniref:Cysteine--tRNA ligase n=2 Tax=Candidatus Campbelliibacteriota TaxID=1752727 RepID=A0A1F5EPX3_9BACT|nr:MAG: cysteine--tRNA ligase [Candidatus Campbellbacteria bacterium RIFCSPHIGHO2_01_FULL_34_10]OGD69254.1 MAG: cysteine--tRNA ligase [Candidatus Campbellbacteria bacterium RIFCSPLOWO2_01_FULL_34_15]
MAINIYNTLSRSKEEFKPLEEKRVGFYQCGPTVYWTQHLGNIRAMVMSDIIVRTFGYLGYEVNFVRNYTDVGHLTSDEDEGEDKLEKGAKRENLTPQQISEKYIKIFEEDVKKLNTLSPTHRPKATETIPEIVSMIQTLVDKGFAYQTDLAIYFDVSKAKDYTKLSGQSLEKNIQGAGSGDVTDTQKKNHSDFALWFFKKGVHENAIQTWKSPWGQGFPGWHIECSAMSKKFIGDTVDIHMGGVEHIPVHHTNEIAQSESANDTKFVNYWIHNEHLLVDGGKMSKSQGTSFSVSDIEKKGYRPLSLRYFFLQAHYRSQQNFTWDALRASQTGLINLYGQVTKLDNNTTLFKKIFSSKGKINIDYKKKFTEKLEDDFNTAQALAVVSDLLKSDLSNKDKLATILDFDRVLGLDLKNSKSMAPKAFSDKIIPSDIVMMAEKRKEAKKNKNYTEADRLRNEIEKLGFEIKDTPDGQKIHKI